MFPNWRTDSVSDMVAAMQVPKFTAVPGFIRNGVDSTATTAPYPSATALPTYRNGDELLNYIKEHSPQLWKAFLIWDTTSLHMKAQWEMVWNDADTQSTAKIVERNRALFKGPIGPIPALLLNGTHHATAPCPPTSGTSQAASEASSTASATSISRSNKTPSEDNNRDDSDDSDDIFGHGRPVTPPRSRADSVEKRRLCNIERKKIEDEVGEGSCCFF